MINLNKYFKSCYKFQSYKIYNFKEKYYTVENVIFWSSEVTEEALFISLEAFKFIFELHYFPFLADSMTNC